MIDEGFVEDQAGIGFDPAGTSALDPKTAALLRVGACVATGSPAVCLEWSTGRALAAGASEDEIAGVLLAIAPVAGLGRVVAAAPEVATALGYDIAARPGGTQRLLIAPPAGRVKLPADRPSPRRQTWQPVPNTGRAGRPLCRTSRPASWRAGLYEIIGRASTHRVMACTTPAETTSHERSPRMAVCGLGQSGPVVNQDNRDR
jgi:4-carboxymuconolactone decarboxylase